MKLHRINALVARYFYFFLKSLDRLTDSIYWPVLDIVLWGLTSMWISGEQARVPHLAMIILTGVVFWQIVWRGSYEISVNLLEEFWNDNLMNLFSTPLTKWEWVFAVMTVGAIKLFFTIVVGVGAVWLLYSMNILLIGWMLLPCLMLLLMSGWFIGFLSAALIVRYGERIQTLAWVMGFALAPFSAVYYPVEVLPPWAQLVAWSLPTTYVFEGMREVLLKGTFPIGALGVSALLVIVYLALSLFLFSCMFEKRREIGFGRGL